MVNTTPESLHQQAEELREAGFFLEALKVLEQVIVGYIDADNLVRAAEAWCSKCLTYRHLYERTTNPGHRILAREAARTAIALAQESGIGPALVQPYLHLGEVQHKLDKQPSLAVQSYAQAKAALAEGAPEGHQREVLQENIQLQEAYARLDMGDTSGPQLVHAAIARLENLSVLPDYVRAVWISGAYMKLAEALRSSQPEQAREALEKAKEIIDSRDDMKLRRGQWERIAAQFS